MVYDFCGIGNSCIDIVDNVDEAFLIKWGYPKSICSYLTLKQANELESALPNPQYIAGGCAANTAAVIVALGGSASFLSCIANDSIGQMFIKDMAERNIYFPSVPDNSKGAGSTRVFALITSDSERTFASYGGVRENLSPKIIDEDTIKQSKFLCLEGYALINSTHGEAAYLKAAKISHAAGGQVAFAPSDISILQNYKDIVSSLIKVSDIILCNEQEAKYMAGSDDLKTALNNLQTTFKIGAVTVGDKGVYVFDKNAIHHVPAALPPALVTDTNGAGDAFAGGFLFGLSRNYDLPHAGALGNRCAAAIITHAGARPIHNYKDFLD